MRLRQRVKGSLPNLPLEACLSSTGWYVVWKSRRLAALSHVTIAVGAPGPVTCHRVMRGTRESVYLVYGPRSNLADLGLEWWRRYGRLHTALGSVSRAPVTHGHGEGYAGRAAPRTEQGGEILGRKCALPWELFGTKRAAGDCWEGEGSTPKWKISGKENYNKYYVHFLGL